MERIALDIETINTVENPDFTVPEHWTVFAVALGHQNESMPEPDVDVLFRRNHTLTAEGQLIDAVIDWIADRCASSDREILTFNGESYDIPILKHRASRIDNLDTGVNVGKRLSFLLDSSTHTDLFEIIREREEEWMSLDDALAMHSIDSDEPEWNGDVVTGADMPPMGLRLLTDVENEDLREVVQRYAETDVQPLFELQKRLFEEQVEA